MLGPGSPVHTLPPLERVGGGSTPDVLLYSPMDQVSLIEHARPSRLRHGMMGNTPLPPKSLPRRFPLALVVDEYPEGPCLRGGHAEALNLSSPFLFLTSQTSPSPACPPTRTPCLHLAPAAGPDTAADLSDPTFAPAHAPRPDCVPSERTSPDPADPTLTLLHAPH